MTTTTRRSTPTTFFLSYSCFPEGCPRSSCCRRTQSARHASVRGCRGGGPLPPPSNNLAPAPCLCSGYYILILLLFDSVPVFPPRGCLAVPRCSSIVRPRCASCPARSSPSPRSSFPARRPRRQPLPPLAKPPHACCRCCCAPRHPPAPAITSRALTNASRHSGHSGAGSPLARAARSRSATQPAQTQTWPAEKERRGGQRVSSAEARERRRRRACCAREQTTSEQRDWCGRGCWLRRRCCW